jgi:hypothetical protein
MLKRFEKKKSSARIGIAFGRAQKIARSANSSSDARPPPPPAVAFADRLKKPEEILKRKDEVDDMGEYESTRGGATTSFCWVHCFVKLEFSI